MQSRVWQATLVIVCTFAIFTCNWNLKMASYRFDFLLNAWDSSSLWVCIYWQYMTLMLYMNCTCMCLFSLQTVRITCKCQDHLIFWNFLLLFDLQYRMGTKFCGVKILRFLLKHQFSKLLISQICYGCNHHALFWISCAMVLVDQWTWMMMKMMMKKQHTKVLFSGQWLDRSNEGVPFMSLSCPATVHVLVWA